MLGALVIASSAGTPLWVGLVLLVTVVVRLAFWRKRRSGRADDDDTGHPDPRD